MTFWRRLRRVVRFLASSVDTDAPGRCPICGRAVTTRPTQLYGTGGPLPIPRPIGELVGACRVQHGTAHTDDEERGARERYGTWI